MDAQSTSVKVGSNEWLLVYNNTGGTLAAGVPIHVSYAATLNPRAIALAAAGGYYRVGVVDNDRASTETSCTPAGEILTATWGYVKVKGRVATTVASATYVAGRVVKVSTAAVTEVAAGATGALKDFGIIITGGTTVTTITVDLFGDGLKLTD